MPPFNLNMLHDRGKAWIIWVVFVVIICILVSLPSHRRTVTHNYRSASILWFAGGGIYTEGIHGFLYLPSAAVLFMPFAWPPFRVSEVLWRVVCIVSLASGVWRLSRLAGREAGLEMFPLMTLLSIPPAMDGARNGQMNLPLAALMIHAVVDLADRRWRWASLWLSLGLALKPLMIVPILLAAAIYRPMVWRLAVGVAAVLLLPFAAQHPAYVVEQYRLCVRKMSMSSRPGSMERFSDLFGIVQSLGIETPYAVQAAIRGLAAMLTLGLCRLGVRLWGNVRGEVLLLAMASCYLMLFNPRTENTSYVLLGPSLAVFAAWAFLVDRRSAIGWMLLGIIVGVTGSYEITRGHNYWLSPSLCLIFAGYLTYLVLAGRQPNLETRELRDYWSRS